MPDAAAALQREERRRTPTAPPRDIRRGHRIEDLEAHPHEWVTAQAFADFLLVNKKSVVKQIEAGTLPASRFFGMWRIRKADAIAFVARGRFVVASSG